MPTTRKRQGSLKRRDATGHLDPRYAAELRLRSLENSPRQEEDQAFLDHPKSREPLAEVLGEEFVAAATTGEDVRLDALNRGMPEDDGGPFVITRGRDEFARGSDPSSPKDATREPFPTALSEGDSDEE